MDRIRVVGMNSECVIARGNVTWDQKLDHGKEHAWSRMTV